MVDEDARRRFYAKVDQSGGPDACWPWLGAKDWDGYGKFRFEGKVRPAANVALHLESGIPIDSICEGRHTCDITDCCNPSHIVPGTHAENMRDKKERNRVKRTSMSKCSTAAMQDKILKGCRNWNELAATYGVSPRRVRQIAQDVIGKKSARCRGEKASPSSSGSGCAPPKRAAAVRLRTRGPKMPA